MTVTGMDRETRRNYLEGLLRELQEQRKVDMDQLLMELLHLTFELDDEARALATRLAELERSG